jgi:hypothetical protein
MKLSFLDLARAHVSDLSAFDLLQLALLVLLLVAVVFGAFVLVRSRRREAGDLALARRLARAAVGLATVSALLAGAALAYHQVYGYLKLESLGPNVTPSDISGIQADAFLAFAAGLLIAAFGMLGGWVLEWFATGAADAEESRS